MDFEDFTNVTELERFTSKLTILIEKLLLESEENLTIEGCSVSEQLKFREVSFKLSFSFTPQHGVNCFSGIPHFCYSSEGVSLQRIFDLSSFWLLECVESGRIVSEATGRLLLGSLVQACSSHCNSLVFNLFVRTGEVEKSEKYFGFQLGPEMRRYFETFPDSPSSYFERWSSAQITLEWLPNNLRINYPGFSGYFDSWHPVERVKVECVWPQRPIEKIVNFSRTELQSAPIWRASYETADEAERVPLRNSMLRSLQAAHLREVLFTPMGEMKLVAIPTTPNPSGKVVTDLNCLYDCLTSLYISETERLEKDSAFRFSFIPKRIVEAMRWERLNESISLLWKRFIRSLEAQWNELVVNVNAKNDVNMNMNMNMNMNVNVNIENDNSACGSDQLERSLLLIDWCIKRELEWKASFKESGQLRKLYRNIPERHLYPSVDEDSKRHQESLDDRIEAVRGRLEGSLKAISDLNGSGNEHETEDEEEEFIGKENVIATINGHCVLEPIILNCEPPPSGFLTRSLLNNPLAGEIVALNQLKEDMRVFKAWNPSLKGISCKVSKLNGVVYFKNEEEEEDEDKEEDNDNIDNDNDNNDNDNDNNDNDNDNNDNDNDNNDNDNDNNDNDNDNNDNDNDDNDNDDSFIRMDIGYLGFLMWHSPNDIEKEKNGNDDYYNDNDGNNLLVISQRMRDSNGQWYELWHEDEEKESTKDEANDNNNNSSWNFAQRVSFNHRSLLGQVLSDLAVQMDLRQLLENATPSLTRKAVELFASSEAIQLLKIEEESCDYGNYPLDAINASLDAFERGKTDSIAIEALTGGIFNRVNNNNNNNNYSDSVLVNSDAERLFLLNSEHEFKTTRKELVVVEESGDERIYWEGVSGFEGESVKLSY
jgi:hypothetical protein